MRRGILLVMATILTATAMGAAAAAVIMPAGPVGDLPGTGSAETVGRFYAAANDVIATGDPARIREVVPPHFVDADPLPGVPSGRAGLEAYLAALHAADPGMRLEAEEFVAAGDRVVARVGVRNGSEAAILGGSVVDPSAPWGAVESFRIAGGHVVERRSDTDGLILIRTLAETSIPLTTPAPRVVTLQRVAIEPGARWDTPPDRARWLFQEAGTLRLELRQAQGEPGAPPVALTEGGSFAAPAGTYLSVTNDGSAAATLLAVGFSVSYFSGQSPPRADPLPPGVSAQTLAGGLAADIGVEPAVVSLGRAALARDARLTLSSAAGPVLLAVNQGQVDMAAWGTAWTRRGEDSMSAWTGEATLAAGDGLLLDSDGLVALRGASTGAIELLILTVRQTPPTPGASMT